MRVLFVLLISLVFCSCLVAGSTLRADDKKEEERWEKGERDFLAMEALLKLEEKEWALEAIQRIDKIRKELDEAERIELFRLKPVPLTDKTKDCKQLFHGYEILFTKKVETPEQRTEAGSFVGKILHWDLLLRMAYCYNPRHGMRASIGKRTLDFVICFECSQIVVYEGDESLGRFALVHMKENPIKRIMDEVENKAKQR